MEQIEEVEEKPRRVRRVIITLELETPSALKDIKENVYESIFPEGTVHQVQVNVLKNAGKKKKK